jgi:hypothetical protein
MTINRVKMEVNTTQVINRRLTFREMQEMSAYVKKYKTGAHMIRKSGSVQQEYLFILRAVAAVINSATRIGGTYRYLLIYTYLSFPLSLKLIGYKSKFHCNQFNHPCLRTHSSTKILLMKNFFALTFATVLWPILLYIS